MLASPAEVVSRRRSSRPFFLASGARVGSGSVPRLRASRAGAPGVASGVARVMALAATASSTNHITQRTVNSIASQKLVRYSMGS
ncbi:hypothetical protein BJX76DRAFT_29100 [Aspergillus varians]